MYESVRRKHLLTVRTKRDMVMAQHAKRAEHAAGLQADWDAVSAAALALFAFGQQEAARRGLLLVDTKYEFGKDDQGRSVLA